MKTKMQWFVGLGLLFLTFTGQAASIPFSELSSDIWEKFQKGEIQEVNVEFRKGDIVPLNVKAEGDLLSIEDEDLNTLNLTIRRTFFIKLTQSSLLLSLDNKEYKPVNELLSGSLTAGGSSDKNGGLVHSIDVLFRAFLK